jgi:hypothetical protein
MVMKGNLRERAYQLTGFWPPCPTSWSLSIFPLGDIFLSYSEGTIADVPRYMKQDIKHCTNDSRSCTASDRATDIEIAGETLSAPRSELDNTADHDAFYHPGVCLASPVLDIVLARRACRTCLQQAWRMLCRARHFPVSMTRTRATNYTARKDCLGGFMA